MSAKVLRRERQTMSGRATWFPHNLACMLLVVLVFLSSGAGLGVAAGRHEDPTALEQTRVLYVTGAARETVPNSTAHVSVGVEVRRDTAEGAHQEAAVRADRVLQVLRSLGVRELTTSGLQLRVEHRMVDGTREIAGYVATNTVEFISDVDAAGEAIDRTVAAGATRVHGITLRPDQQTLSEAMDRVERAAARNGVERADRVLRELGLERRAVSSVRLVDSGYAPLQDSGGRMVMRAEAFEATTPVEAGTSSAEARVELQIRY